MSHRDKPHIAIVARQIGTEGSEPWVAAEQCNHLTRHFDITAVGRRVEGVDPEVRRRIVRSPDLHGLRRFGHVPRMLLYISGSRRALARLHEERPVDFVLCHGHETAAWAALPLQRRAGVPFGLVTHGDIFRRPRGTYGPSLTALYKRATPLAYNHADLVVALSPYMAELARRGGATEEAVEVIPNGIALTPRPAPADPGPSGGGAPVRFLFVGRLDEIKNIPFLLQAFAAADPGANDLSLTVVGDGPPLENLRRLARSMGIEDSVEFPGRLNRETLPATYRSHDVFCITSIDEVLPTVVLEAMREALPVVGVDVGGIPFLIEDGKTGVVTEPGDVDAFGQAMLRLAASEALRRELGRAGRDRVEREFAWPTVADRIAGAILQRIGRADRSGTGP